MAKRHLLLGWVLLQGLSVIAMDEKPLTRSGSALRQSTEKLSKSQEILIPHPKKSAHRSSSSSSSSSPYYHSPCGGSRNTPDIRDDLKPLAPYNYHTDYP